MGSKCFIHQIKIFHSPILFRLTDDRYIIQSKSNTLYGYYYDDSIYIILHMIYYNRWIDLFDLSSDICLLTDIYMAFFPVGIWLVCENNMPTTSFTVLIFPAAFLMDSLFLIFLFALQTVWEERNVCISFPVVGILFQGFNPPDPYFTFLVI